MGKHSKSSRASHQRPAHRRPSGGHRDRPVAVAAGPLGVAGALLVTFGLLGGCGGGPPEPPASVAQPTPATSSPTEKRSESSSDGQTDSVRALSSSKPVELRIPAIDVHATEFVPLGLQPNGKIEVPQENDTVGWYKKGPTPGEFGPAVLGAHVDSDAGPALFYSLGELRPGDKVEVRRADGKTAVFTVYSVEQYPKDDFPTQKVYTPTEPRPELRLITCGGSFNEQTQHYRSNIVAYAKMTAVQ